MKSKPFRLNAARDFYVEDEMCIACAAPEHEAPDLMAHEEGGKISYQCYFRRQPTTLAEQGQAIRAVWASCCGAVRYKGNDPGILKRLKELGSQDACDNIG